MNSKNELIELEKFIQNKIMTRCKCEIEISCKYNLDVRNMLFNNIDLFKKYKMAYNVEVFTGILSSKEVLIKIIEDNDNEIIDEKIFKHMASEIADKNL